jgi:hypothetical protein
LIGNTFKDFPLNFKKIFENLWNIENIFADSFVKRVRAVKSTLLTH